MSCARNGHPQANDQATGNCWDVVRLALRALEREGIFRRGEGRGCLAQSPTVENVLHAVEVRGHLESLAARLMAQNPNRAVSGPQKPRPCARDRGLLRQNNLERGVDARRNRRKLSTVATDRKIVDCCTRMVSSQPFRPHRQVCRSNGDGMHGKTTLAAKGTFKYPQGPFPEAAFP